MCNVVIKAAIAAALPLVMAACGGSNSGKQIAEGFVNSADSAVTAGNYALAIELLDTLQAKYPDQIEAQRKGMHIRPLAMEKMTMAEMQMTDSLQAYYAHLQDSLMSYFAFVNNPELVEGYYVIKEYEKSSLFNRTGVEGRVSPDGEFYMISSLTAKPVKHTAVTLKNRAGEVSTAEVAYDGDRNYRSGGTEMVTFIGAECDTLCSFLLDNPDSKTTLIFKGTSSYTTPLQVNDNRSIALAYQLSNAMQTSRKLTSRRELLDKQLLLARDQAARTAKD